MAEEQDSRQGDILSIGGKKCPKCTKTMVKKEITSGVLFLSRRTVWSCACGYTEECPNLGAKGWGER